MKPVIPRKTRRTKVLTTNRFYGSYLKGEINFMDFRNNQEITRFVVRTLVRKKAVNQKSES